MKLLCGGNQLTGSEMTGCTSHNSPVLHPSLLEGVSLCLPASVDALVTTRLRTWFQPPNLARGERFHGNGPFFQPGGRLVDCG